MQPETSPAKAFIDLLQRTSPLAWYKYGPDSVDLLKSSYPPLVVWRFEKTSENQESIDRIEQVLAEAIRTYCGEVRWSLVAPGSTGRNWALWPKLCQELMESGQYRMDPEVRTAIKNSDPDHGIVANRDLYGLVDFLAAALAAHNFSDTM